MSGFPNHFSAVAADYASHRPTYPAALFEWLADQAPARGLAWDCATGSGQAARDLAGHFDRVIATDAAAAQIEAAVAHPGIEFRIAPAEASGLDTTCVDLVTVAQALHWFRVEDFFAEARRVLVPGGVIAVWSYSRLLTDAPAIDERLWHFYSEVVGPWWPFERRHVETGYRDLPFPFEALEAPHFAMQAEWNLAALGDYLRTWSATRRYIEERGDDPVMPLLDELAPMWGAAREVRWPLNLRTGRHA
ncbi:MAG TPA: methyltransferase domain-containing protein [Thioalkalivibrio sp.]|nr:methyltransferase domain-containing protein [Thioalkalivibrio sp.]